MKQIFKSLRQYLLSVISLGLFRLLRATATEEEMRERGWK